jgi:hypothetical protein
MRARSWRSLIGTALLFCLSSIPAAGQVRVVIDASADGGLWWNPVPPPAAPGSYQGKPLADFLRNQGMTVTELVAGTVVTCAHLSNAELVIVINGLGDRTAPVVSAYAGYVANGGRLILLTDHRAFPRSDSLSSAFGLAFGGSVAGAITTFAPHPITANVTSVNYLTGSIVTRAPAFATMLGSIAGQPVMGVMPFGYGRVFFMGDVNAIEGIQGVIQPLTTNLLAFMLNGAGAVNACRTDLAIDFGSSFGVWKVTAGSAWSLVHPLSPEAMIAADLDGNGFDDLVFDFGSGIGVYAWMNHATWLPIHPLSPTQLATGDLDDDGRADLLAVFPGFGIWRWHDGAWTNVHPLDANRIAVGDLDSASGPDELIADFPGHGVYLLSNNTTWSALHGLNTTGLMTADLDGNGQDEIVVSFPGYGLYEYRNNASWVQLSGLNPTRLAAGRIDVNTPEDLVADFGSAGIWTFRNNTTWTSLHLLPAEHLVLADLDGNGQDEVIVDFGPAYGLWQFANNSTWSRLHPLSPEEVAAGRIH